MLVAIAVFAIGHPSGQKLSNQASRKFGLGGRSSNGGDFDVDSSGGDAVDVSEELAPSETMSEEDREEVAVEEAEEAQEEAAEEAAEMGLNNDAAEAVPSRSNMDSMARWAALGVPEVCIRPGVAPSGVIPGLELHDRYDDAFYTKPAGTTAAHTDKVQHTEEQQAEHEDAKEELQDAKEDLKDAVEELKEEIIEEKEERKTSTKKALRFPTKNKRKTRPSWKLGKKTPRRLRARLPTKAKRDAREACLGSKSEEGESLARP